MGPPLQYEPPTFNEAARSISGAAWSISEVAATLTDHQNAATTPDIRAALFAALNGCKTGLITAHGDVEQVAFRVQAVAGVMTGLDNGLRQRVEGSDYDTRHYLHPYPLFGFPPNPNTPFQNRSPLLFPYGLNGAGPYPKLPGE